MNFYLDFEATQPEQEIISIGMVAENGATFYSLVQPKHSKVSKFITELTGITNEDIIKKAKPIEKVFNQLYVWLYLQEHDLTKWNFYSYGKDDVTFLKNSLVQTTGEVHLMVASIMIATMKDYSEEVCRYFCCNKTSLICAFNYLKNEEKEQKHNALEDAQMLAEVAKKISGRESLKACPFGQYKKPEVEFEWPVGKVITRTLGKQTKVREYNDLREAIEWIIQNTVGKAARPNTSRKKMAQKILKSIEENKKFHNYMWEIVKEEQE